MKLYYVTADIMPNEQSHFIGADDFPDMSMPVWTKAQVIDAKTAKTIKELHGFGFTAVVNVDMIFKYVRHISFVDDMGCTHAHMFYVPAL
jgi:hypothetical protein